MCLLVNGEHGPQPCLAQSTGHTLSLHVSHREEGIGSRHTDSTQDGIWCGGVWGEGSRLLSCRREGKEEIFLAHETSHVINLTCPCFIIVVGKHLVRLYVSYGHTYLYLALYVHSVHLNKSRFAHACLHLERKPSKLYKPLQLAEKGKLGLGNTKMSSGL